MLELLAQRDHFSYFSKLLLIFLNKEIIEISNRAGCRNLAYDERIFITSTFTFANH